MLTARKTMDVVAAYKNVGTYRGAAEICGVDPKTVKRKVAAWEAGQLDDQRAARAPVAKNTDVARQLVAQRVEATKAKVTAKRLLPEARAVGYVGSARNFRRLVAAEKKTWRARSGRQRRPAVWTPGDALVIDWGTLAGTGIHVFCAVLAWSRIRFVRFARDETAATTFAMLAECFEAIGGVPAKVLADRMGCLKAGTVAGVVIPTPDYVRFATHYGFSPDFCHPGDPASKGIVENLVGYAKRDIPTPDTGTDLAAWNRAAAEWCEERNSVEHSEICAVPADRLDGRGRPVTAAAWGPSPDRAGRDPQGRQAGHDPGCVGPLFGPLRPGRHQGRSGHLRRGRAHLPNRHRRVGGYPRPARTGRVVDPR